MVFELAQTQNEVGTENKDVKKLVQLKKPNHSKGYKRELYKIFEKVNKDTLEIVKKKTGVDLTKAGITSALFRSRFQNDIYEKYLKKIDTDNTPAWFHKFLEFFEIYKKNGCVPGCGYCCSDYGCEKEILESVDEHALQIPHYPGCSKFVFKDESDEVTKEVILNGSKIKKACPFLKLSSYPDEKEFDVKKISIRKGKTIVKLNGNTDYMALCGIHNSREELVEKIPEGSWFSTCIKHQAKAEYSQDCVEGLIEYAKRVS